MGPLKSLETPALVGADLEKLPTVALTLVSPLSLIGYKLNFALVLLCTIMWDAL